MTNDVKFGILVGKFFIICFTVTVLAFIVEALRRSNFTYVCYFTYPYVEKGSLLHIPLNIVLQMITVITGIGLMLYVDVINFFIVEYLKGEFRSISHLLISLNNDPDLSDAKSELLIFTTYCCHVKATEKLENLRKMCWYIYLNQAYSCVLYMCMCLYMIRFGESSPLFYFVSPGVLSSIFLMCYTGQIVLDGTSQVTDALGEIKWYRLNVRNQKNLILFMVFAQRSKGLGTFALNNIGMETFLQLLKAIFSYCAFLYTVLS
ncbi:hypothetical protein DMENIID0001_080810 [Sergentomyia squamirostris]